MNKRFFALLVAFALTSVIASAQIKQANKFFQEHNYTQAITYYLKTAQNTGDPDRTQAIARLADCYRLSDDLLKAKAWYAQAVELIKVEPITWFFYGQSLCCAQEYDLAKKAFDKYAELVPADPRGKVYAGYCSQVYKLSNLPAAFEVKNAYNLNSDHSDFGPAFFGEGMVYTSDRLLKDKKVKNYERSNFNELSLFFARPRYMDEFYQEMNEPKSFKGQFNQTLRDGPVSFARHDSIIFFSRTDRNSENGGTNNFRTEKMKLFSATNTGTWSSAVPFFLNSDVYTVGHPSLSPDGKTLYFISDMPGGYGGTDIYSCEWTNEKWGKPKNLGEKVNSIGDEMYPHINGNNLYFASDGWPGFGGLDIFCASLEKGTWSKPWNLGRPINSSFDDFSLILDKFGKKGFFSSNRPGGVGYDDIYACKRLDKNAKLNYGILYSGISKTDTATISGYVKDKQTNKPIPGSIVFLVNTVKGKVKVLKTDISGFFKSSVEKGVFYLAKGMENNYLSDCLSFEISTDDTASKAKVPRDILLDQLALNKTYKFNNMDLEIESIYFDFDKWFIRPDAEVELDKLVQVMKENQISIELGSHTDCRGSEEYNMDLSQKRAESVVRYIVLQGIDPSRIVAKGYGESFLTNHCSDGVPCSPAEHQANRRTEFKVTKFNSATTHNEFDLGKFVAGDEIPAYMFDKDFFINCLQDKLSKEAAKAEPENAKQPAQTVAPNITVPPKVILPAEKENVKIQLVPSQPEKKMPAEETKVINTPKEIPVAPKEKTAENAGKAELKSETSDITYKVQLFALSRFAPLNSDEFVNLENVQLYEENGLFKYTAGIFDNYKEARAYRDIMVEDGYEGAFVVMFENGKHVNLSLVNK
jgi:outer membrane protein OmpA-like peptidoglycan-associated protein/tetratricopeptide (TPR) repeat protein